MPLAPTDPHAQGAAGQQMPMGNMPAPTAGRNALPFGRSPYSSRLLSAPTQPYTATGSDQMPHSIMTGGAPGKA